MKPLLLALCAVGIIGLHGCGPRFSVACDNIAMLCADVDLAVCDATMDLVPPFVRKELVDCTNQSKTCEEAVGCFTSRGYQLPNRS